MAHSKFLELQKALENWQHFAPCLGANVTIYDSEEGYWNSASGLASLEPKKCLSSDVRFYIFSITKTFTAIVVMRLVENGLVALRDSINKHLPNVPLPENITIKHLLNHTSGVPSYTALSEYILATKENPSTPWSFDYVIDRTCSGGLDFEPGEGWEYSNTGYMLLLLMIEAVTKKPYSENIEHFIVQKIGLKNTYVAEKVDKGKLTKGYCRSLNNEDRIENITDKYNPWWCKTGLIVSTSKEVTKVYEALYARNLVSMQSLNQMKEAIPIMKPAGPGFQNPSYGLGLMVDPEFGFGGSYGHGGDGPGFNTWSVYYPDFYGRSLITTIFCNTTMHGHPFFLVKDFLRVLKN